MKIHHVGIASKDIEKAIKNFRKTHKIIRSTEVIFDKEQNAYLAYLETEEGLNVEFTAGKQVENIIKKGISYYHLAYEVDNIDEQIEKFRESGASIISPPKPAALFKMRRVAFLYTSYGLVELLESDIK